MGYIDQHTISQIREGIDISDIVGEEIDLKRQGQNYVGHCPWHDDTRPSLQINVSRQQYKCWVCDVGGDVFSFLMRSRGLDFPDAVRYIADKTGYQLTFSEEDRIAMTEKSVLYDALDDAATLYAQQFWKNDQAQKYAIENRGINDTNAKEFGLGFAPNEWDFLLKNLSTDGNGVYPLQSLEEAGLIKITRDGKPYDFFRGRLMFPVQDLTRRVVGFAGRDVTGEENAKYINSPETPVYQKRKLLYGLEQATPLIKDKGSIIISEGYTDAILGQQNEFPIVAVCGTAFTQDHNEVLQRKFSNTLEEVILGFDGDTAGRNAAIKTSGELLGSVNGYVCFFPNGEDPASILSDTNKDTDLGLFDNQRNRQNDFENVISQKQPLFDFYVHAKKGEHEFNNPANTLAFLRSIANDFSHIPEDAIGVYVNSLSEKTGIDIDSINQIIFEKSYARSKGYQMPSRDSCETELLHGMIANPLVLDRFKRIISPEAFTNPERRSVYGVILRGGIIDSVRTPLFQGIDDAVNVIMKENPELRPHIVRRLLSPTPSTGKKTLNHFEEMYRLMQSWNAFNVVNYAGERGHSLKSLSNLVLGLESAVTKWEEVSEVVGSTRIGNDTNGYLIIERNWDADELPMEFGGVGEYLRENSDNFTSDIENSPLIGTNVNQENQPIVSFDVEDSSRQIISIANATFNNGELNTVTAFSEYPTEERNVLQHFLDHSNNFSKFVTFSGSHDIAAVRRGTQRYRFNDEDNKALKKVISGNIEVSHLMKRIANGSTPDNRLQTFERTVFGYDRGPFDIPSRDVPQVYEHFLARQDPQFLEQIVTHGIRDTVSPLAFLHKAVKMSA